MHIAATNALRRRFASPTVACTSHSTLICSEWRGAATFNGSCSYAYSSPTSCRRHTTQSRTSATAATIYSEVAKIIVWTWHRHRRGSRCTSGRRSWRVVVFATTTVGTRCCSS